MYQFIKHGKNGPTVWSDSQSVSGAKIDLQIELEKASIQMAMIQAEEANKAELRFRAEIGLSYLETDAKILHGKLVEAAMELAFAVEMGKNDFVINNAKQKSANTRKMYNDVRKKIFKICLQHGVKSEHSTRS